MKKFKKIIAMDCTAVMAYSTLFVKKTLSLLIALVIICGYSCAFANTFIDGDAGYGQYGDVFVFHIAKDTGIKTNWSMNTAENGGPVLDDNDGLLMPMKTMCANLGYKYTTVSSKEYHISNGLRTIVIPKEKQTVYIDGKENEFKYRIINDDIYFSYTYIDILFDIAVSWNSEDKCLTLKERETTPISYEELELRKEGAAIKDSISFAYSDCNDKAVAELTEIGVLSGYDDGTFKPDGFVTRAEFSKMISLINGGPQSYTSSKESGFIDVDIEHWAFNYIAHCNNMSVINGYEDGTFKPNENVSYAEAIKICLSTIGYNNLITEQADKWYEPWIELGNKYGVCDSKDDDFNRDISRMEAAKFISRTLNLPICQVSGYDFSVTPPITEFHFADGTTDKNGKERPFVSLLTLYFQ